MSKPESIGHHEEQIIEEFEIFEDPMDRYAYIIDLGNELGPMPESQRTDQHLVRGCQSNVWLTAHHENGRVYFSADSNTVITKGIIALLVRVLSGQTPSDIAQAPLQFIEAIGLREHLSSQRSNGLTAMITRMRQLSAQAGLSDVNP